MKKHYRVYYLLDSSTGKIIYIGITTRLVSTRKREHEVERGLPADAVVGLCQRFNYARKAKEAEKKAIKRHRPLFNKIHNSGSKRRGDTK